MARRPPSLTPGRPSRTGFPKAPSSTVRRLAPGTAYWATNRSTDQSRRHGRSNPVHARFTGTLYQCSNVAYGPNGYEFRSHSRNRGRLGYLVHARAVSASAHQRGRERCHCRCRTDKSRGAMMSLPLGVHTSRWNRIPILPFRQA